MQSHRLQQTPRQWKAQGRGEGVFFFHRDQKASMRTNSGTKAAGSGQRRRRVLVCSGASPTDETRQKRPLQGAGHDIFGRADGRRGGGGGVHILSSLSAFTTGLARAMASRPADLKSNVQRCCSGYR